MALTNKSQLHDVSTQSSWLKLITLCLFSALAFQIGSPLSAGPDEPEHQATAWYDIHHLKPTQKYHTLEQHIPNSLIVTPCFAAKPNVSASCIDSQIKDLSGKSSYKINNYPPLPYWIMGLGQVAIGAISADLLPYGGRLSYLLGCFLLLLIAFKILFKTLNENLILLLFLFYTPMMLFLAATCNPSAFECSAALAFTSSLFWHKELQSKKTLWVLALLSLTLAMARPVSFIWLTMIVALFITVNYRTEDKLTNFNVFFGSLPGILFGITWRMTNPSFLDFPDYTPVKVINYISFYIESFLRSINLIPLRLEQSWGVLGWLDTAPSPLIWLFVTIFWTFFLTNNLALKRRSMLFKILPLAAIFLIFSVIEASGYQQWPNWWQGRYQLPMLGAAVLILSKKTSRNFGIAGFVLLQYSILCNLYMLILNFARYNWGIEQGLPSQIHHNSFSSMKLGMFGVILVVVACNVICVWKDPFFKINSHLKLYCT